ncbi:hypothetical protein VTO73DRAFT_11918 [Trametes versicolor]
MPSTPDTVFLSSCTTISWLGNIIDILNLIGPAAFTTLRARALSGGNNILTGAVFTLSIIPFLINTVTLYQIVPVNLPAPSNCTEAIMERNIYFCTLVSLNTADIILVVLAITTRPNEALDVVGFIDPICSILNSRFLLALYETNASLERGGASDLSFSLNIDGLVDGAKSPDLPEFLTSLAGPVHITSDDEADLC